MKLQPSDPAPALTRGLTLLQVLEREGACSLDKLTSQTKWPKSSVLRFMRCLEAFGAVLRDPISKRYRAAMVLKSLASHELSLREAAGNDLIPLCESVGTTVELFQLQEGIPTMVDRSEPEGREISVRMRIGARRDLLEIEGIRQIVLAYTEFKPHEKSWVWQNGTKTRVGIRRANELAETAKKQGYGMDLDANSHGFYRIAVPLMGEQQKLLGILTAVRHSVEQNQKLDKQTITQLKNTGQRISVRLGNRA